MSSEFEKADSGTDSQVTFSSEPRTEPWRMPDLILDPVALFYSDHKTGGKNLNFLLVSA